MTIEVQQPPAEKWPKKIPIIGEIKGAGPIAQTIVGNIPDDHEARVMVTYDGAHTPLRFILPVSDVSAFLKRNDYPGLTLSELVDLGPLQEDEKSGFTFEQESLEDERPILVIVRHKTADGGKSIVSQEEPRSRLDILNALTKAQDLVSKIEADPNRPDGKFEVRHYSDLQNLPEWLIEARKS